MKLQKITIAGMALSMLLPLWGCSSNLDSDDSETVPSGTQETVQARGFVGADRCIDCHEDFSWSQDEVNGFLQSGHVIHSPSNNAASDTTCLECHDPVGDGQLIQDLIDPANVPPEGLAAVTCEACHGSGEDHFGIGPMPNAHPEAATCGECHTQLPESHLQFHPEADNIFTDWQASAHADADGRNQTICVKCHNDEGARRYRDVTTFAALQNTLPIDGDVHAIQCRTCHDSHNVGNELLKPEEFTGRGDSRRLTQTAEYATCTNCHQDANAQLVSITNEDMIVTSYNQWLDAMNALAATGVTDDGPQGDLIYHSARYERVISSTHYDNPLTSYESERVNCNDDDLDGDPEYSPGEEDILPTCAPNQIEGYVVKATDDEQGACRGCHNLHSADLTINRQWAGSAHGGEILEVKEGAGADGHSLAGAVAIRQAGVTSATGDAWLHYDWDAQNRQSCQRCHTATGLKNFMADTVAYDSTANDYSHLVAWSKDPDTGAVTSSGQNEMLYCWGCHANNSGALRDDPNGITLDFVNETPDSQTGVTESVVLPEKGNSDVCGACHAGRGNNTSIRTGRRSTRFAGHHAPTAGSLYAAVTHTGFEYTDVAGTPLDYSTPNLQHDDIDAEGDGPCVSCHMAGTADHHFTAVTEDAGTGNITAINNQALCDNCHGGGVNPDFLNQRRVDFTSARQALLDLVNNTVPNYLGVDITQESDLTAVPPIPAGFDTVPLEAYGAFQNSLYMTEEPCIRVHNSLYGRRLMFDSIDWLDNGVLDGVINLTAYPVGAAYLNAGSPANAVARP